MNDISEIIFTKEECDDIIYRITELPKGKQIRTPDRLVSFECCFITPSPETQWIFNKLYEFIEDKLNVKIISPLERLMVNHYVVGDEFEKHKDLYIENQIYNVVVNLNEEYQGGEFKLYLPDFTLETKIGNACIFENTRLHEVTKILKGERFSMIAFFLRNNIEKSTKLI